eukprot:Lankesteria_metandrocarpae@DN69_c0_g1_i1.p1
MATVMSAPSLAAIFGEREQGSDVRSANVLAVNAVANMLKTTLGPKGLDKMIVDDIGEVTISNDGATIIKMLEVQHPAARILVDLSDLQDKEVGDGTTSVVLIAAELLKRGNDLVKNGVHPTSVIAGYKLAMKESVRFLQKTVACSAESLGSDVLLNIAKTTLSSKYIGTDSDFIAPMIVNALQHVKFTNEMGQAKCPVRSVNLLKTHGKGSKDSILVDGYALARIGRAAQGMPTVVCNAKIALIDFNLKQHRMQLGVQIQVDDPTELERIRQREKDVTKEKINKILAAGANVIITSQGIDDLALKYFVEAGALALRRVERKDLRRLAKATGATICSSMAFLDEDTESFSASMLGQCGEVSEGKVGDWDYIFFKECSKQKAQSIILRGANDFFLDELERSVHDALCAVARAIESKSVLPGGGAAEAVLATYLEAFARTLGSKEQLPVAEFAAALLIIPRTLAVNAAQDAADLVALLRSKNYAEQHASEPPKQFGRWGLDLVQGQVRDSFAAGVLEPTVTKVKAIRFATEAAITVLRIDDVIKVYPEPEQQRDGY